jgi:erythromycin esterase-like protein
MFKGNVESWNVRDRHMFEVFDELSVYLEKKWSKPAKIVVWAHNSHIGDARATEKANYKEWNVGQLVREHYIDNTFLIGFSTYTGIVAAASNWDAPMELKEVRPALSNSYEALFHEAKHQNFLLDLAAQNKSNEMLYELEPLLQRAIGVIYHPETERQSHYYYTKLIKQFDAFIHFDLTSAVRSLDFSKMAS